jgi:Na+/H+ antiporter NhaC
MNLVWLATAMIPKKDRNQFDKEENGLIKSKTAWKKDIYTNLIIFVLSVFFVVTMEVIPIPYLGFFTFIGGIMGLVKSVYCIFRALVILKEYDKIFSEELIKKLVD